MKTCQYYTNIHVQLHAHTYKHTMYTKSYDRHNDITKHCFSPLFLVVAYCLLLLYALFNHPRLLIQVARVQKAQFSYRLDGLVP